MTSLSLTTCSITGLKVEINEESVSFDYATLLPD